MIIENNLEHLFVAVAALNLNSILHKINLLHFQLFHQRDRRQVSSINTRFDLLAFSEFLRN